MSWRGQIALSALCALVLAGLTHFAAILLMPWLSDSDALSRLRRMLPSAGNQVTLIPTDQAWPYLQDPATVMASCTYRLAEGPLRVSARTGALFESLSFHARGGTLYFAVTERAAVRGSIDLVVMTRAQQDAATEEDGDEPSTDVRIVAPQPDGFVIVRVLAGLPSQREEAVALAKAVTCTTEPSS